MLISRSASILFSLSLFIFFSLSLFIFLNQRLGRKTVVPDERSGDDIPKGVVGDVHGNCASAVELLHDVTVGVVSDVKLFFFEQATNTACSLQGPT